MSAVIDTLLATRSIGISDLRDAPAKAFEKAGDEAVVVLSHNKPAGYLVSNQLMAQFMEALADKAVATKAQSRLASLATARRITLDEL